MPLTCLFQAGVAGSPPDRLATRAERRQRVVRATTCGAQRAGGGGARVQPGAGLLGGLHSGQLQRVVRHQPADCLQRLPQ